MRGEHCVLGASILSAIAVILLLFAHIGQVSPGAFTSSIYMAELNVEAFGNGFQAGTGTSAGGLYDTKSTDLMGTKLGLRQYYRYGFYKGCGYQKDGSGICNSTTFGYPFEPFAQMLADTPAKFTTQTADIIGVDAVAFKNNSWNHNMSRAGSLLIFFGSLCAALALIVGWLKARIFFFIAAAASGLAAFCIMIGAALWTALIAKDGWLKIVKVKGGTALGITINAGASLYLTWIAFALITLSVAPYVIACCTFRRQ